MKIKLAIISLLFISISVLSSTAKPERDFLPKSFYKHFKGIVKKGTPGSSVTADFPVSMNLRRIGKKLTGGYYYLHDGEFLTLSGEIDNNGSFKLNDYNSDYYVKGTFSGLFLSQDVVKGTWTNADTGEEFSFELTEDYTDSQKFKSYKISDKYHIKNKDTLPFIEVNLDYLHLTGYNTENLNLGEISNQIEKQFFGEYALINNPGKNITTKRNDSFSDYKNYIERGFQYDPEKNDIYIWKVESSLNVIYNEKNILTTYVHVNEDIGGVAGFGGYSYSVFDIISGLKLTLDDIFISSYEVVLNAKLIEKIKDWHDIKETDDMIKAGFEMDLIIPTENFYVDNFGIGFYYNVYEIYELESRAYFKFSEIKNLLKKDSPIYHLLSN